jgi:hypothetical protein
MTWQKSLVGGFYVAGEPCRLESGWRLSLLIVAGVDAELPLSVLALYLLPAMALGLWIG